MQKLWKAKETPALLAPRHPDDVIAEDFHKQTSSSGRWFTKYPFRPNLSPAHKDSYNNSIPHLRILKRRFSPGTLSSVICTRDTWCLLLSRYFPKVLFPITVSLQIKTTLRGFRVPTTSCMSLKRFLVPVPKFRLWFQVSSPRFSMTNCGILSHKRQAKYTELGMDYIEIKHTFCLCSANKNNRIPRIYDTQTEERV